MFFGEGRELGRGGETVTEGFEVAHARWLKGHIGRRAGERKGRLERNRYAETMFLRKVWWPIFRGFDGLHPEYEVLDWRGRPYYADFVLLPETARLAFEVKGYGPHVTEMDRRGYCEELNRETFLQGLGYRVVSIPHDDVEQRPDVVQSLVRMVVGRYQAANAPIERKDWVEREIVLLALRHAGKIRPQEVERHLQINHRTAVRRLQALCESGWLRPVRQGSESARVSRYTMVARDMREWMDW